ncbi:MAG: hypothetical protein HY514_01035 [Candidatus Aenigmarchaeota archaeon]|nr:hypothetical protein [Candidatus Aenigmarchaeota archaeon]
MKKPSVSWTAGEKGLLYELDTPGRVQAFVSSLAYDPVGGGRSPRRVMRERKANCFSGALFAAAALSCHGYPPLLVNLFAENDDEHILAVFKRDDHWGAASKSNFTVLSFREPVYRTLRELVISYFDLYFNSIGQKTLRSYSKPLNLSRFDGRGWLTSEYDLDYIADALGKTHRYPLVTPEMIGHLEKVDEKLLAAGLVGSNPEGLYKPKN